MSALPLIDGYRAADVFGVRGAVRMNAGEFVARAQALASRLPAAESALLLCRSRVAFAMGLAALALRGTKAVLPASHAPHAIARVANGGTAFALVDGDEAVAGVARIAVDPWTGPSSSDVATAIPAANVVAVVCTSGTTGAPRPHAKTWSSLIRGARALRERVAFRRGDCVIGAVPPQHMWGLEATVMLPMQSGGVLDDRVPLLPADIAAAVEEAPARRWLVVTPLHVRACVESNVELASVAGALTATAPLDATLAASFERRFDAPLIEIYGSTETGVIATRRTARDAAFVPLPGVDVVPDEQGIRVHGGHVDSATHLSDRIVADRDGAFSLAGRDADLVKIGGKRASLAALDTELKAIDGVDDGAFVVVEDSRPVPRLSALYASTSIDVAAVLQALRERIDPVFLPRPLHRVDALPRNALGKLSAEAVRDRVRSLAGAASAGGGDDDGDARVREFVVPASHPALPGHFPGRPIVPAAWLLTLVGEACADAFAGDREVVALSHARFRAPLAAETRVRVEMRLQDERRVTFTCRAGDVRIADGAMTLAVAQP